jgi:hyperosmotically inducible protein
MAFARIFLVGWQASKRLLAAVMEIVMKTVFTLAIAFAAGALVMYYLDPAQGRRRRAVVRDRGMSVRHGIEDFARTRSRHAAHRMQGVAARARAHLSPEPVEDAQLRERIRSKLGRVVEHSSAVEVEVHDGQVILSGIASAEEIDTLLAMVTAMLGVSGVESRLRVEEPEASRTSPARH